MSAAGLRLAVPLAFFQRAVFSVYRRRDRGRDICAAQGHP